jgi:hypothetical protein
MSIKPVKSNRDILDLKIKVPHLLAQRLLLSTSELSSEFSTKNDIVDISVIEEESNNNTVSLKSNEIKNNNNIIYDKLFAKRNLINSMCMISLLPFIIDVFPSPSTYRQQLKGCVFLLLAPITFPCLFFFNIHHKNSKKITIIIAIMSIVMGNITCILFCSSTVMSFQGIEISLLTLSLSLILGTFQLLMLINKKNIAIVMISTATTVIVCGLSIAGIFLPSTSSKQCYQSTIPCIIWLFWQASQNHTFFANHLQVVSSDHVANKHVI